MSCGQCEWPLLVIPRQRVPSAAERCADIRRMVAARGWTQQIEAEGRVLAYGYVKGTIFDPYQGAGQR